MDKKLALQIVGGLSEPGKMPCFGTSLPAENCHIGSKLRELSPNSVCSTCYACKGRYVFPNVQKALQRRLTALNHPRWVEAMSWLIGNVEKSGYFRWHDSGDVQSAQHMFNIALVAKNTPMVQHWLPTKEYTTVISYAQRYPIPSNLNIRLSGYKQNQTGPIFLARQYGFTISGVYSAGYDCPAYSQGGKCLDCRKCWDKSVFNVKYKLH